jgi:hypothetical protein
MTYGRVVELAVVGIEAPGTPNEERIALRPMQALDLGDFLIVIGPVGPQGVVIRLAQWLGAPQIIQPPSWLLIYTGGGVNRTEVTPTGEVLHLRYLGYSQTVFGEGVGVGIIKIAAVLVSEAVRASDLPNVRAAEGSKQRSR